jgi:hypothetical protein
LHLKCQSERYQQICGPPPVHHSHDLRPKHHDPQPTPNQLKRLAHLAFALLTKYRHFLEFHAACQPVLMLICTAQTDSQRGIFLAVMKIVVLPNSVLYIIAGLRWPSTERYSE